MIIICPVCRKKTTWDENPSRPFCSERCKYIDFDKWVTGAYAIPGAEKGSQEDAIKNTEDAKEDIPWSK